MWVFSFFFWEEGERGGGKGRSVEENRSEGELGERGCFFRGEDVGERGVFFGGKGIWQRVFFCGEGKGREGKGCEEIEGFPFLCGVLGKRVSSSGGEEGGGRERVGV